MNFKKLLAASVFLTTSLTAAAFAGGAIDVHSHVIPADYLASLQKHNALLDEGFPLPKWDVSAHLKWMDEAQVQTSVLTLAAPQPYFGDANESAAIIRKVNEVGTSLKKQHPGRFMYCAALPLPDVKKSIAEAAYALDMLKADCIKLATNVKGQYLGAPELDPLFDYLNKRRAVVILHPHRPVGMQGHYDNEYPTTDQFVSAATKYGAVVGKIMLTEVDFKSSKAYDGTAATLQGEYTRQAYRYKALYDAMKKVDSEGLADVTGFTVWGVIDGNSWLQAYTGVGGGVTDGSPQCPLLFDDDLKAKPAFWAIVDPTKLAPETKAADVTQAMVDDFALANKNSFSGEKANVDFYPIWNEGQLQFRVDVWDVEQDERDSVKVYVDKYNSKSKGIKTKMVEAFRKDVPSTDDGKYTVIINVPVDTAEANAVVGFDIVVTDGDEVFAFNDNTMSQETSSQYYAEGMLKPFMFIPKGTATIDGEMEDAWNNAVEVKLGNKTDNPKATATVKLLWDEQYLYAYATVVDDDLNKDSDQVHEQDSFEIFIDEINSKAAEYNDATKQYRINYENAHSFNGEKCTEENESTFAKTTDNGYIVEGAFKWTEITPKAGDYIGIELQINDADSSAVRIGTVTWNDITNQCWSSPACYGTATLVDSLGSGQTIGAGNGTDTDEGNDGNSKSKVGLFAGIAAAAVLAGAAAFISLKKQPEDEEESKEAEAPGENFDEGEIKSEAEEAAEEAVEEAEAEAEEAVEEAAEEAEAEVEEAVEEAEEEAEEKADKE